MWPSTASLEDLLSHCRYLPGEGQLASSVAGHRITAPPLAKAILAALLIITMGCNSNDTHDAPITIPTTVSTMVMTPFPNRAADHLVEGYVGSDRCRECHAEIVSSYEATPMGRSMHRIPSDFPLEDRPTAVRITPPGAREYRVQWNDHGMQHVELRHSAYDRKLYEQSVPIHFAVGSGQHGRSYLTQHKNVMFMSPLTWYSEKNKWDLSPGYPPSRHPRFERRIADGCISCHAGLVNAEGEAQHRFAPDPFHELSIGCERCHGPGREHIAWYQNASASKSETAIGKPLMVNPASLSPAARESVCLQCHIQGLARVLRSGRSEFSFRPGELISDCWTILVADNSDGRRATTAVSQAEQMMSSVCYQRSDQQLGCISCHDAHSVPTPELRGSFYRERCLSCHEHAAHCGLSETERRLRIPEDSCIECHMPGQTANDVPHTTLTDHRILARPTRASLLPGRTIKLQLLAADLFPVPPDELDRARGIAIGHQAETTGNPELLAQSLTLLGQSLSRQPGDLAVLNSLGNLLQRAGRLDEAKAVALEAHRLLPSHEAAIELLGMISIQKNDIESGLIWATKLAELNPYYSTAHWWKAYFLARQGQVQSAIASAERTLELDPTQVEPRRLLIHLLTSEGDAGSAAAHQKILNSLEESPPGH